MAAASNSGLSLDQLAAVLAPVGARVVGDGTVRVTDVSQDSRQVKTGYAFVARSGAGAHGLQFAAGAIASGARALITQDETGARAFAVPAIVVEHERKALALAAEALHDFPSRAVKVIAVTGTNGKTTVAVLTEYALQSCGQLAARLGTLGFSFQGQVTPSNLTTEEADQVSRRLAQVRDAGGTHCVLEASSHALSQHRLDGLQIEVAAFTNLTQDHLDYHGDLQHYGEAKARLFTDLSPRNAVIHTGDAFGEHLAQQLPNAIRVGQAASCHVRPLHVVCDAAGIHGDLATPSGTVRVDSPLVGRHNLENILVVLGIASALDLDVQRVAAQLATAPSVPGRFERCDVAGDSISVLVDYAHTPDALSRVLKACRELCSGKLICVFGCG
ncbi:MAG TPA: UDP-N-acetylmuramoyl-L-alanyl-D-glutamate--2,6-diaminopimelate ligase, partial [Polyangiaceae bacterium]|nr:UDP-N-acetylmuramoyl-L-alanyl-D-glutamate--2,6-diaminopimelate ligase [Polyangiaceae bacterium]